MGRSVELGGLVGMGILAGAVFHGGGDIHGGVGTGEVDDEVPGLVFGGFMEEGLSVFGDPVIAIGLVGEGGGVGEAVAFAAFEIVDVDFGEAFAVEQGHVGIFGRFGAGFDGVAFAGVIDAGGEAPFL